MSQIKDTARWVPTGPSRTIRQSDEISIDGQISGLLTRRNRLLEDLAQVDQKLAELRDDAVGKERVEEAAAGARWFPVRGEQLAQGKFAVPEGLDREDLNRRLSNILVEERRGRRGIEGLELLVAFQSEGGRILSVRTRRPGDTDWIRRFEAITSGPGH